MSVQTGDVVTDVFTTSSPTTGAAADADSLPTGTLYVDGVANGATVTVADLTGTGRYSWSVTIPTVTTGQRVRVVIAATIGGLACGGDVWSDRADVTVSSRGTSTYAGADTAGTTTLLGQLAGITVLANWLRGMVRKDVMDATAKSELNAGGGAYNEATDSSEAIRDRGDAAWVTATGFSTLVAQDVRDAMKLAPSVGSPADDSVDKDLDDLQARVPDALDGGRIKAVLASAPPTAAQIDTQLSGAHGSGPWGAGSGGSVSWPYVVTDGANPLQDVEVWVTAPSSDIVLESGRTDATGTYTFTLDPGTYWFYARMAGYTPTNPDVEVVA